MQTILNVLILEDVPADAALMERELKKADFKFKSKIVQAEKDFLYELNSFKPDIILSDYRLPAFNGLEALEIVKNISPDTPFIIVTGTLDEITAVSCIKKGVWDYILKGNLIRLGPAVQEALKLKEEIEKRKSAEQAQQEMEQQYREIFNSSTDAFLIFDMRGNIKEANPQACKMYGYKYKELIKLSGKDIVHPDYYHLFKNFKIEVRIEDEFFTESVDVHKDGTFFDVEVKGSKINFKGKPHLLAIVRDITERKQAEEALRKSEEQFRLISENTNDSITLTTFDLKAIFTYVSPSIKLLSGYEPEELIGKSCLEFIHPEDKKKLFPLLKKYVNLKIKKLLTGKESDFVETIEYRIKDKSGNWRYAQSTGNIVGNQLLFISRDITERKQAEKTLQHEKDFYHSFVESLSDWVWEMDIQGVHTYSNQAVENILGYKVDEIVGFSTKKLWSEKQQRKSDKWYREGLTSGKGWKNFTAYFQHKDGSIRILESTAIPIYDTGNKLVGYRGIDHDITNRMQAEQKIQESEEKYRTLTENLNVAVYRSMACDKNKLIEINSAFVKMFGYKNKDEIKKIKVSGLYQNPKEQKHMVRKIVKNGFAKNEELILKRKDGSQFIGSVSAVLGRDKEGTELYYDGIIEDITERKEAENALQKSNKELRKLQKELEEKVIKAVEELRDKDHILIHQSRQASMGEMIGNIAHQWRQPLSAVAAIIQNYEDAYEDGTLDMDYIEEHTDLIMDILQQMSRTIDDFRNFFKPNKLEVDFNVKEIVLKTIKFLETSIKFNNINLILNLPDDCIITGFPNEYSQVILVILNNAKDVLLERKIKEKEIEINLKKEKNKTILQITDNAGGISVKVMDKIFNPYFTTKEDKGTGVGLYMSKMIIEKNMKGKLTFGNTKKGAEFKIEV